MDKYNSKTNKYGMDGNVERKCVNCRRKFKVFHGSQKFCSEQCYQNKRKVYLKKYMKIWERENKEIRKILKKKWKENNPEKLKAWGLARRNIKMEIGQLCEICNIKEAKDKHHVDYNKPLEIMFLCKECHQNLHRGIIRI